MSQRVADRFLARHPELLDNEHHVLPEALAKAAAIGAPLERYFRFRYRGLERIPEGACLLVANHSIGAISEILLMVLAWYRHFRDRPARGLTHRVVWQWPFKALHVERVGCVLAHPEVARRSLQRGDALLVFPGGDLETCRPFAHRYEVNLGNRTGFARLARDSRVPIVPVVFCGSHATYFMLPGAEHFARWSGIGQFFGMKAFPLTAGAVSVFTTALMSLVFPPALPLFGAAWLQSVLPMPSRIEMEVLDPIHPREDESDQELAERVRQAMQEAMDRMAKNRKTPWG